MTHKKTETTTASTADQAATLESIASTVGGGQKRLTTKERRQKLKLRTGGVETARTLATLATRYKVDSVVDVPAMLQSVAQLEELQPLLDSATNLQQTVHDKVVVAAGDTWTSATTLYTVLQRMALNDPRLADELAPVAAKFAKKKSTRGTPPAPVVTASTTPAMTTPAATTPAATTKPS